MAIELHARPLYFSDRSNLVPYVSDRSLSLLAPIVAYWIYSLFFMLLDHSGWAWINRYRIHEPEETKQRNKATVLQVVKAVALQQIIQTALGWWWLDPTDKDNVDHVQAMLGLYRSISSLFHYILSPAYYQSFMISNGFSVVSTLYWWLFPAAQFALALFVMDTWQYFLHRLFHTNQFLYRNFHCVHHRLYVPYAFGALYNHWFEGLLLDTLGAVIAHTLAGMTVRQGIFLFTFSTLKTVDDHCGYAFPFDPFQVLFPNNSTYHDIHHRVWGIKYNFSQPFFVHWDAILGTRYVLPRHKDE
ncbi:sphingosine hydroxylase [Cantharellus anzutake]|uniref:sphingosine hydroxylase n=1 Tax=Cantharellus anzutake TaxID=1750568 RepID=UPI001905251D|nr:sphingosine hydroxylase [Cantharellus anzutake]KAF8323553.1 sphingosine hydroxylase [Cantharellus anzutake]